MSYERGPFGAIALETPKVDTVAGEFGAIAGEFDPDLAEVDDGLDKFEATVFELPLASPTADIDGDLTSLAKELSPGTIAADGLDDAEIAAPEVDEHIVDSTFAVPAESFVAPQEFPDYTPEVETPEVIPEEPGTLQP